MQQFYHLKEGILLDLSLSIGGSNAKQLIFCKEELGQSRPRPTKFYLVKKLKLNVTLGEKPSKRKCMEAMDMFCSFF